MRLCLAATLSLVFLLGCADLPAHTLRVTSAPNAAEALRTVDPLQVLHVRSALIPASGFPITPSLVITAAHVLAKQNGLAAVDSLPMVQTRGFRRRADFSAARWANDWRVLYGKVDRFTPNIIDPDLELRPGDKVLLGGFFVARDKPSDPEYWMMQPSIVEGRVVEPPPVSNELAGLVWVQVPLDDYHGFSGGPAAWVDSDGNPRVWGVHVYGMQRMVGFLKWGVLCGIAPLPSDLLEQLSEMSRRRAAARDLQSSAGATTPESRGVNP